MWLGRSTHTSDAMRNFHFQTESLQSKIYNHKSSKLCCDISSEKGVHWSSKEVRFLKSKGFGFIGGCIMASAPWGSGISVRSQSKTWHRRKLPWKFRTPVLKYQAPARCLDRPRKTLASIRLPSNHVKNCCAWLIGFAPELQVDDVVTYQVHR